MTFGRRFARLATDAVVRWPWLWPVFRPPMRWYFDKLAPIWDEFRMPDSSVPYEAALERVDGRVTRALDVGTGTGLGARAIRQRFPEAEVVGIDVAPEMIALARERVPEATFQVGDASRLAFGDGEFDLVTHANMIPFLDETERVLRPGGWALYAFSSGAETPIYVTPERLRRELERRGFTDFAEISAGRGNAVLARKAEPD